MKRILLRCEDRVFAWVAQLEYRLKLAPRGVRLTPTPLHRLMLRFLVSGFVILIGVFAFTAGATRTRALLVVALGALCAALVVLAYDANRGTH